MIKNLLRRVAGSEFLRTAEERERRETSGYTEAGAESTAGTKHPYEDAFFCLNDVESYAVFDGMSTSPRGDRAAKIGRDAVKEVLAKHPVTISVEETERLVITAIAEANARIYRDAIVNGWVQKDAPNLSKNLTTVVVLRVCRPPHEAPCVVIGHIGDSRAYLQHEDGSLEPQTVDDSLLQSVLRSEGRIRTDDDAMEVQRMFSNVTDPSTLSEEDRNLYKQRNVTTEMAGQSLDTTPVIKTVSLEGMQGFLLVTDGVSDNFTEDTIAQKSQQRTNESPASVARRLAQDAHACGISGKPGAKNDDATAVFGRFLKRGNAPEQRRDEPNRRSSVDTGDRAVVVDVEPDRAQQWSRKIEATATYSALYRVIREIGVQDIDGKTFNPEEVIAAIELVNLQPNRIKLVTRAYGIRNHVQHFTEIQAQLRAAKAAAPKTSPRERR